MSFMWVLWQKNSPCTWQIAFLMVRSLNSHQKATFLHDFNTLNEHRFNLEYLQILSRHTNDIKHSFIFKKGFINPFYPYNGIIEYKMPSLLRLIYQSNTTTFLTSFLTHSDWILSMSFSVNFISTIGFLFFIINHSTNIF